jgi:YbbR domain-containing protein
MPLRLLHWLGKNFTTLLLAFGLALVVWVSAVVAEDPNQQQDLVRLVPIQVEGQDTGLLIMGNIPTHTQLTLNAPRTVWNELNEDPTTTRAWIDLSGLGPGEHTVEVHAQVRPSPVQKVRNDPATIHLVLEPLISETMRVTLVVEGTPALGYQAGSPSYKPTEISVSGAESLVSRVVEVRAVVDITNASHTITSSLPLRAVDENGEAIEGVTLIPDTISVEEPIELLGEYRNVIVKVVTIGQVANGYKLTNITVSPPNVIVFSSDPRLLNSLPGYVETMPLDLTGLEDDIETLLNLSLPEGISVVTEDRVVVQVSVAAIETNVLLSLPVEIVGLQPGFEAVVAPETVDVILSGPVPILNTLRPSDLRVVVDLSGLELGAYQLTPLVDFLPPQVKIESILPMTLEVVITFAATPTPSPTPTVTPSP